MHYYFQDRIEKDNINNLIEKIDVDEEVHLYFSTDGGHYDTMQYLIDFLNSKENIVIHLVECVMSAGCLLFTYFKGKLILEDGLDYLMFHVFDRQVYHLRKDGLIDDRILKKQTKQLNENFAKKIKEKGLLTDTQLKKYINGYDVVVYKQQFDKWVLN
jgi:hypothetical protein